MSAPSTRLCFSLIAIVFVFGLASELEGQLFQPRINSIALDDAPRNILRSRNESRPINPQLLQRRPTGTYLLDEEDVLGIFIEGVLGDLDESPPVQVPGPNSNCLLYTSPSPRDATLSRMPSSA